MRCARLISARTVCRTYVGVCVPADVGSRRGRLSEPAAQTAAGIGVHVHGGLRSLNRSAVGMTRYRTVVRVQCLSGAGRETLWRIAPSHAASDTSRATSLCDVVLVPQGASATAYGGAACVIQGADQRSAPHGGEAVAITPAASVCASASTMAIRSRMDMACRECLARRCRSARARGLPMLRIAAAYEECPALRAGCGRSLLLRPAACTFLNSGSRSRTGRWRHLYIHEHDLVSRLRGGAQASRRLRTGRDIQQHGRIWRDVL